MEQINTSILLQILRGGRNESRFKLPWNNFKRGTVRVCLLNYLLISNLSIAMDSRKSRTKPKNQDKGIITLSPGDLRRMRSISDFCMTPHLNEKILEGRTKRVSLKSEEENNHMLVCK